MIKKILTFTFILLISFTFSTNVKANSESFYSRTLLGRIADNSWQQAGEISSTGNSITLSSDALSSYYPYWIGGYGNKSGNFETNKTYFLNFKINYPSTTQFDFKKAMQYAQMEIVINNVHVNLCTLESNTNTYSTFTCQFTVSSASSYYEFNVNWYNSNLHQLGFTPIYNYEKATLSIDFILSSQTDNSGLIVEQNEIIIGQNQQIIDSTNDVNNSINDAKDSINDTIKDNFNDCYSNLFNINDFYTEKGGGISYLAFRNNLKPNTTYTLTSDSNLTWIKISTHAGYGSDHVAYEYFNGSGFKKLTFTTNSIGSSNIYLGTGQLNNWSSLVTSISQLSNVMIVEGTTIHSYIPFGKEVCQNKIDETNNQLGNLNDSINNSDTSNATNSAGNFFSGFETDTFGLTSIITAPLDLIGSITSSTCSPLPLTIPYVDKPFNLPCMTTIYENYFSEFLTIYQTITFGIVAYWVCVRIFNLVKDFKNPDHDEIEVVDL